MLSVEMIEGTERSVTLYAVRNDRGSRYVGVRHTSTGEIVVEGQDLNSKGADAAGPDGAEYEWAWTIRRRDVRKLLTALGGEKKEDVLVLLMKQFSGERASALSDFLITEKIPTSFWSRVGD